MKPGAKALLIDITRCIGCGACAEACKVANDLPPEVEPKLTADTWTVVMERGAGRWVRDMCRHCLEPTCASVCPVGALVKTDNGPVVYNKDICLGCRYCMIGCPFRVPKFEWDSPTPQIQKCIMCAPRLEKGLPTACAEACPTEATVFGERDALVAAARARIAAHPERYHPHVYGLSEVGGTSVLYLSPVPFEELEFDTTVADFPLPKLTWRLLLHVPNVVMMGVGFLSASYWLYRRREQVAMADGVATTGSESIEEGGDA